MTQCIEKNMKEQAYNETQGKGQHWEGVEEKIEKKQKEQVKRNRAGKKKQKEQVKRRRKKVPESH